MESSFKILKERFTKRLSLTPFITAANSNQIETMERQRLGRATAAWPHRNAICTLEFNLLTCELYRTLDQVIISPFGELPFYVLLMDCNILRTVLWKCIKNLNRPSLDWKAKHWCFNTISLQFITLLLFTKRCYKASSQSFLVPKGSYRTIVLHFYNLNNLYNLKGSLEPFRNKHFYSMALWSYLISVLGLWVALHCSFF